MWALKSGLAEASWMRFVRADNPHASPSIDTKAVCILGVLGIALGAHVLRFDIVLTVQSGDGLASDGSS